MVRKTRAIRWAARTVRWVGLLAAVGLAACGSRPACGEDFDKLGPCQGGGCVDGTWCLVNEQGVCSQGGEAIFTNGGCQGEPEGAACRNRWEYSALMVKGCYLNVINGQGQWECITKPYNCRWLYCDVQQ